MHQVVVMSFLFVNISLLSHVEEIQFEALMLQSATVTCNKVI